jgi:hypothetical protein
MLVAGDMPRRADSVFLAYVLGEPGKRDLWKTGARA